MTASQWLEVLASYSVQVLIVTAACALLERTVLQATDLVPLLTEKSPPIEILCGKL